MTKPRSIFEEVGEARPAPDKAPKGGMIGAGGGRGRRGIRAWLIVLFLMVAAMVVVGGLTRLTDSGLSITQWKPLSGALPPMNDADWQAEFALYQASPEYQLQNHWMSIESFKSIYWWEWGHRQLGRVIGLVWALGFGFFWLAKCIPAGWARRLLLIGGLGGLQGAVGWWMVASGLSGEMVDVASYRLATHLGLAFVIFGFITWYVLLLGRSEAALIQARRGREKRLFSLATGVMHLAFLQILLGALVAGIDAGRNYVDWPWMAGQFFPPAPFEITPLWRNFFENAGLVQFIHRMTGYALAIFALVAWRRSRASGNRGTKRAFDLLGLMVVVQMCLGIYTVLYAAPLSLAIIHQIGAIITWVVILNARYMAGYPAQQSVRG